MQTIDERQSERGFDPSLNVITTVAVAVAAIAIPALALLVVVASIPLPVAVAILLAAVSAPVLAMVRARAGAEAHVLAMLDAVEPPDTGVARLANVVEGLCLTMGMNKPRLLWWETATPVAMAAAATGSPGCLVVSRGFVEQMDRMETEAVVAQLLVGLRSGTIEAHCFSIAILDQLSRWGVGRLARFVLARKMTVQSSHAIDAQACRVTRYPPALASALAKISQAAVDPAVRSVTARLSPLMVVQPGMGDASEEGGLPSLGEVRLTAGERIDLIKEI